MGIYLRKPFPKAKPAQKKYSMIQNVTVNVPAVTVTLKNDNAVQGVGTVTGSSTQTGDIPTNANDTSYDYVKTTVSDGSRTVNATMGALTTKNNQKGGSAMTMIGYAEYTAGKSGVLVQDDDPDTLQGASGSSFPDKFLEVSANVHIHYPAVKERTYSEWKDLPGAIKNLYVKNNSTGLYVFNDTPYLPSTENGVWWDYIFTCIPEKNNTSNAVKVGNTTDSELFMALLLDRYGREAVTYCLDAKNTATQSNTYTLENLDEANYFTGTAAQKEAAKNRIRAVGLNGYWGTASGMGNLTQIRNNLKTAINDSASGLTTKKYAGTTYSKSDLLTLAGNITASEALVAT